MNKDSDICEAAAVIESHYIAPMRSPIFYLLSKIHNIQPAMNLEQASKVLQCSEIQVGFSDSVIGVAEAFSNEPRVKTNDKLMGIISEVLNDSISRSNTGVAYPEESKQQPPIMKSKSDKTVSMMWEEQGLCNHCGGKLGGLFTKKCKSCGKVK